jgi:hypothetical protein
VGPHVVASVDRKQRPRAPGSGAPRVPRHDGQIPRVLFTSPECLAIVITYDAGEDLGDYNVRERAVVEVVSAASRSKPRVRRWTAKAKRF